MSNPTPPEPEHVLSFDDSYAKYNWPSGPPEPEHGPTSETVMGECRRCVQPCALAGPGPLCDCCVERERQIGVTHV